MIELAGIAVECVAIDVRYECYAQLCATTPGAFGVASTDPHELLPVIGPPVEMTAFQR